MLFGMTRRSSWTIAAVATALLLSSSVGVAAADQPLVESFPVDSLEVEYVPDFGVFAKDRIHQGVDILAAKATPVVAVADGFVVRMWRGTRAGYSVAVRHANGWESRYLHLDNDTPGTDDGRGGRTTAYAPGLTVGAFVAAGTLIGFVGDSGNAEDTPPHLHFELRRNRRPRDPYPELERAFARILTLLSLEQIGVPIR